MVSAVLNIVICKFSETLYKFHHVRSAQVWNLAIRRMHDVPAYTYLYSVRILDYTTSRL